MQFPQYRKYQNEQSFFVIKSHTEFTEYRLNLNVIEKNEFKAKIHPDRLLIRDMLTCKDGFWIATDQEQLNQFINK